MSFYLPKGTLKPLHVTSSTTVKEVIEALLAKYSVTDNPKKYALFEQFNKKTDGEKKEGKLVSFDKILFSSRVQISDLITLTEEILNGKLHFSCSTNYFISTENRILCISYININVGKEFSHSESILNTVLCNEGCIWNILPYPS